LFYIENNLSFSLQMNINGLRLHGYMPVKRKSDQEFYEQKSWGSQPIKQGKDLPTLKLSYLLQMLKGHKKNASLLEIGSGAGRILASIRQHDKSIKLTGAEVSKEQLRIATRDSKGKNIKFVHANGEHLPFAANSFDYVIFLDVIEHVDEPEVFIKEASRVLKKGGYLYAFSPAEGHGIYWLSRKIFRRHFKEQVIGHIQQYEVKDLEGLSRRAKLKIKKQYYSYHLLGSIMDYTLFTLLLNKRIAKVFWSKNQYYQKRRKPGMVSRVFNAMLSLGNAIAFYESTALKNTRFSATGVHIIAKK
jgi:SAM-dependent methyltransferase